MATSPTEPACRLSWQQRRRRFQPSSGWFADGMKMCRQAMPSWESADGLLWRFGSSRSCH